MQDHSLVREIFLKKQLIIDACEPYIETKPVNLHRKKSFNMCCFGKFELGDSEFIFGSEENNYNAIFNDQKATQVPIVFAKVKKGKKGKPLYELAPKGDFTESDIEIIEECINHTLEGQRVISHYGVRCFE